MSKTKAALLGAALVALAGPAMAGSVYVGGDYQFSALGYPSSNALNLPQHVSGYDMHAGYRLNSILGVEAGYMSADGSSNGNRLGYDGATLDGFVYLPLAHGRFEPFLTAGGAWLSATAHNVATSTKPDGTTVTIDTPFWSRDALTWRAGLGIESQITSHISARVTARYSGGGFAGRMGERVTLSAGLNFFF